MKALSPAVAKVLKRLHYPLEIMLVCVRWYVAYPLSLRNLEEMMAERGIAVDHSTVHRWAIKLLPVLEKAFRRCKRPVGKSWRMDESVSRTQAKACVRDTLSSTRHDCPVGLPKRFHRFTNSGAKRRTQRRIVVCASDRPRSAIISTRSRRLSL
ncbi:hypothetical protein OKW42_001417 [Paraburkholderia sp. WC7.3d]